MNNGPLGRAPNYTNAALVMGVVNLFWFLGVVWAIWGFAWVLVLAAGLNWAISMIASKRA